MKKRNVIAGLCLMVLLISFYIFNRSIEDTKIIEIGIYSGNNWGVPQIDVYEIYEEAIKRFEKEHNNVKVVFRSGTLIEDYSEWLAQQILKGTEPDVFIVLEEDFNTLSDIGMLEPLDKFIQEESDFDLEDYYYKALEGGNNDGRQFAMPFQIVPTFMIVNKTLLDANNIWMPLEDWTLERFKTISQQLTRDTDGDQIIDQYGSVGYQWDHAYYASNGTFENGSKAIDIYDEQKLTRAIEFNKDLYQLNMGQHVSNDEFGDGHVGFKSFSLAEFRAYKSYPFRVKKYSDFQWEAVPFPVAEPYKNQAKLYTVQLGMSSRSKEKDISWDFIRFMMSDDDIQQMVWDKTYALPTKISAVDSIYSNHYISDDILDPLFLKNTIEQSVVEPTFKAYNRIRETMDTHIKLSILEGKSAKETIRAVRKNVDDILFNID